MQIKFNSNHPAVVIAEAETRHDAYDLGALQCSLVAAGKTVEVISIDPILGQPSQPDYIALKLRLA